MHRCNSPKSCTCIYISTALRLFIRFNTVQKDSHQYNFLIIFLSIIFLSIFFSIFQILAQHCLVKRVSKKISVKYKVWRKIIQLFFSWKNASKVLYWGKKHTLILWWYLHQTKHGHLCYRTTKHFVTMPKNWPIKIYGLKLYSWARHTDEPILP